MKFKIYWDNLYCKFSRLKDELQKIPIFLWNTLVSTPQVKIVYIRENADWSIKWDAHYITQGVKSSDFQCVVDFSSLFYTHSILHFGSINTFLNRKSRFINSCNQVVVTVYHGNMGISHQMDANLRQICERSGRKDCLVVSNSIMKKSLVMGCVNRKTPMMGNIIR